MRVPARLILALEGVSVLAILVLSGLIRPALKYEVLQNMTPANGHRNRSPQAAFTEMSNDR